MSADAASAASSLTVVMTDNGQHTVFFSAGRVGAYTEMIGEETPLYYARRRGGGYRDDKGGNDDDSLYVRCCF